MRIPRLALLAVFAALAAAAVPALAAPEQSGVVSASSPVFKWDGGPGNGTGNPAIPHGALRCQPVVYECEDTLIELKDPGSLTVEIKAGSGSNDLDLRFYKSDASGTAPDPADDGNPSDATENADAKITARNLKPGFYIARVLFYNAVQGTYTGTATFSGAPAAPPPAPAVTTPPVAAPTPAATPKPAKKKTSKRKACEKKAKKIKNKRKRARALKRCKKIKG